VPDDSRTEGAAHNEVLWEQNARWWQRTFTRGADPEYEAQILPLVARHLEGATRVLDIGCGEGQVSRRLAESGAHIVGIDPTLAQVREAHARGDGPQYARARAEALPCRAGAFDAVVLCLALEHVDAFAVVFEEVARVLTPGGRFVLVLAHPFLQAPGSGWVESENADEHFWRIGAYLGDQVEVTEIEPGVSLRFVHRPLSRYMHAMGQAGLLIDDMEEPAPPAALLESVWDFPEAATIPRIMLVRATRLGERGIDYG
jgi:ubiquinone/menaquinone biosynthesis C-methylase UbiE